MFTGLYPPEHGIRDNVSPSLAEDSVTLAEVLQSVGFRTGAFVSSIVLESQSGLHQGFETYSDQFDVGEENADVRFLNTIQKRGDETTAEAVDWLRSHHAGGRAFLWLHLYDPHDPYDPPEPYATRYSGRPYDGEVAWSDELVGRLDTALAEAGIRDDTLLVVTSDHGEALGEHGETGHGYFVYETTLRVPLIFRGPGIVPGLRLEVTARSVDLFPTILDLLGLVPPQGLNLSGRSLAEAIRGEEVPPQELTYAESLMPFLRYGWSELHVARRGSWKYIQAPKAELYDLESDPDEEENLLRREAKEADALRASLEGFLEEKKGVETPAGETTEIPPGLAEKLGALGYLGSASGSSRNALERADPKDKLAEFKIVHGLMREGLTLLQEKDYGESIKRFQALLERGHDSFEAHYYLGRALVRLRSFQEARPHLESAAERDPGNGLASLELAECRLELNDPEGALAALRAGQKASPRNPRLYRREGEILLRSGRRQDAARAFEKELDLAPQDALLRVRLGEIYRDLGETDAAIRSLREAVALDPEPASYWNSLGMILGGAGNLEEAEEAFREAIRRDGSDPQYAYNLGLALLRLGRPEEAEQYFRKTLALEPGFQAARERLAELTPRQE
jgi:arylsulfatase A-like enzyme/Flp pilus assembly protein TadD